MAPAFAGFPPSALKFLRDLERNNTREWFQPRKELFEEVLRKPMVELVSVVNDKMRKFAADYVAEPRKAIMRIYRDTRFSKDKTPYKTNIAASFNHPRLVRNHASTYYIGLSHKAIEIAGGMYMPGPEELAATRKAIEADYHGFRRITGAKALVRSMGELQGRRLMRVPKGFPADSPAADALRMMQFYYYVNLPASAACGPSIVQEIVERFRLITPVVTFLANGVLKALHEESPGASDIPRRPEPMF